jgi:hypothetical protein
LLGELEQGVEDDAGAEGEADEADGADADVAFDEDVGEQAAGGPGPVEGVRPRVIDEVAELGEDCAMASAVYVVE